MVGLLAGAAKGLLKKPKKIDAKKFAGKMEETKAASQPKGGIVPFQKDSLSIVKAIHMSKKIDYYAYSYLDLKHKKKNHDYQWNLKKKFLARI